MNPPPAHRSHDYRDPKKRYRQEGGFTDQGSAALTVQNTFCFNQGEKGINFYFIMVPLRKKY